MASAKRQLPPLSTASPIATVQATDAERQPATQLNESIRDRLRAQVTAARIKVNCLYFYLSAWVMV